VCSSDLAAEFVKLRYFVGLTHKAAAETLGISDTSAYRLWAIGKTWLYRQLNDE
jgi:DNA-directed RNA polymerase specialized sigma subunit